jgi:plasmid stabilization system protein ParE
VKLRYTLPALADLSSILAHVATHSPQGAKRVEARIQAIIDLLLAYPNIGVRTDDPVIRRLMTAPYPYLVFYEGNRDGDHHPRRASCCPQFLRDAGLGVIGVAKE